MGQLSEKRTVARRCLIWGLLIMALYMGWRNSIYGALPLDVYSWVQRDTLMNGPRIIGILGLLAVCAQYWGWREMGLTFAEPKKGVGYGLLMVGVWFIDHLMGARLAQAYL